MRICYVADGTSLHTQRWLNYFAQRGHEVHLICWKIMPGFNSSIQVHMLRRMMPKLWPLSQYINFWRWPAEVRQIVATIKPELIDGHFITIYGFISARADFHPLVVTAWGSDVLVAAKKNPIFRWMANYAMNKADMVVCTAENVKSEISNLGVDDRKVQVIVIGGIDAVKFHPMPKNQVLLQKFGIGPQEPVVISTRSLAPIYNVITLIQAIPTILSEIPAAKFIVCGKGNQENHLRELARQLGIEKNVVFAGWVPHDDLATYLSSSDVYVSTSLSDGTSNCLLEAMACGLPAVVTDIPANRPWIQESENGFLFPVRNSAVLANQVLKLLLSEKDRKDFGYKSRHMVEVKADPEIEMQKLEGTYRKLIEDGRSRP